MVGAAGPGLTVRTGVDGTVALPSLPAGEFELRALRAPAWTRFSVNPAPVDGDVELAIPPGCWLEGQIVDADGVPAVASVALRVEDGAEEIVATTANDGSFALRDVASGRGLMLIARQGPWSSVPVSVTGAVGERVSVALRLTEHASLQADAGRVVGEPAESHELLVVDLRGPRGEPLVGWRVAPGATAADPADLRAVATTDVFGRRGDAARATARCATAATALGELAAPPPDDEWRAMWFSVWRDALPAAVLAQWQRALRGALVAPIEGGDRVTIEVAGAGLDPLQLWPLLR